jgi:ABC-type siderophore export system fused ATPase/permease subunit
MAPKPNKSFAKATTKLGLTTTIAALLFTAVPLASAVADVQISAARAAALQQCNRLAARYPLHDWGNTQIQLYRSCMAQHGQQE